MKKCPNCGNKMDDNQKHCLVCDYVEKSDKRKLCPECGETLVRGVCYRCGYRGSKSNNTCPYCRQKLINGACEKCGYSKRLNQSLIIFFVIVAVIALIALI